MGLFFFRAEGTLTFSAHPATATISESARNIWSPRYRVNRLIEIAKSCRCSYRGEAKSLRRVGGTVELRTRDAQEALNRLRAAFGAK